mgnify:CR=1 FL=1
MKATGIVRRIDDLGRVVIPKEIRRTLRIREGDPLEIFTDREGEIILKKYSPIGELAAFCRYVCRQPSKKRQGALCVSVIWIRSWQLPEMGEKKVQEKYNQQSSSRGTGREKQYSGKGR